MNVIFFSYFEALRVYSQFILSNTNFAKSRGLSEKYPLTATYCLTSSQPLLKIFKQHDGSDRLEGGGPTASTEKYPD